MKALAHAVRRILVGEAEAVPPELVRSWPELAGIRLRRGGLLVRIAGWPLGQSTAAGITIRRTVFLAPRVEPDAELLLHELRHAQQFEADLAFPLRYLVESLRRGYTNNRYEQDANRYVRERLAAARRPAVKEGSTSRR